MKALPLTRGKIAQVDDRDYALASRLHWTVTAQDVIQPGSTPLKDFLMDCADDETVIMKDGNPYNCQRSNMVKTKKQWRSLMQHKVNGDPVGVTETGRGTYTVKIYQSGVNQYQQFGTYKSLDEAMQVADAAIVRLFGKEAPRNGGRITKEADEIVDQYLNRTPGSHQVVTIIPDSVVRVTNRRMTTQPTKTVQTPQFTPVMTAATGSSDLGERNQAIRSAWLDGVSRRTLAERYNLSVGSIAAITNGIPSPHATPRKTTRKVLTAKQEEAIIKQAQSGMTQQQLAEQYHVSKGTIVNTLRAVKNRQEIA